MTLAQIVALSEEERAAAERARRQAEREANQRSTHGPS